MARHRRMLAPIQSIKHYVQVSTATVAAGAATNIEIVDAVSVAAVGAATNEVEEGSLVKAIFNEMWLSATGSSAQTGQFNLLIEKVPSGQAPVTAAQMATLSAYPNKKNILYHSSGIIGVAQDGPTVPIIRNWIMIPKGKQRFGLGDRFFLTIVAGVEPIQHCGFFTYKEYK